MHQTRTFHSKRKCKKIVKRDPQGNVVAIYDGVRDAVVCHVGLDFTEKQLYNHLYHSMGNLWHGYYWEWQNESQGKASERSCIGTDCGRKFISRGPHNRFCPTCTNRGGSNPVAHKVHADGKR